MNRIRIELFLLESNEFCSSHVSKSNKFILKPLEPRVESNQIVKIYVFES